MKNAEEVMLKLQTVFDLLLAGEIKHKDAAELNNNVGKQIAIQRAHMEHHQRRQEKPDLEFFRGKK